MHHLHKRHCIENDQTIKYLMQDKAKYMVVSPVEASERKRRKSKGSTSTIRKVQKKGKNDDLKEKDEEISLQDSELSGSDLEDDKEENESNKKIIDKEKEVLSEKSNTKDAEYDQKKDKNEQKVGEKKKHTQNIRYNNFLIHFFLFCFKKMRYIANKNQINNK